ncbi:GNAT family N-acetyltransferase [Vibrio penaeicida]|uniref:GNAT family N-acetyltransferase n=1 Tax=Vibrio penaeicida TaxID=104609 RepID=UPI002733041C|nr:GNAT family N-acetyltransferase [Vibrio penaeicida]MDP2573464.1 GNAT family N-acetyltransferase [Vibrio penaeicida]
MAVNYKIVPFKECYTEEITTFWRENMRQSVGINPVHSFESQMHFLSHILPLSYRIFVAVNDSEQAIGFMAIKPNEINQLYIHPDYQGKGIGSEFIRMAKSQAGHFLELRTFEFNKGAQSFYIKHGFEASLGNCDNEEGLPDILFRWDNSLLKRG